MSWHIEIRMDINLKKLSHWGRVAFAAKCVRRVQPIFVESWPESSAARRESVEIAIQLSERSAIERRPIEGLKAAALAAGITAGSMLAPHLYPDHVFENHEVVPATRKSAELASLAVKSAQMAAEVAISDPDNSFAIAIEAYDVTINAIRDANRQGMMEQIEVDFRNCVREFPRQQWWKFW